MDIGRPHVLHSRIFPLIISYIPIAFSFYVPQDKTVSRVRNKPHFVSLLSSLCFSSLSLSLHYHRYSDPLSAGGGKRNTFPRGCVLKKRTSNEKAVPMRKPVRGMRSSKYHLDPSIIVPFSSSASSSQQNRLVNPFEWLLSDIFFCIAFPLRLFRDSYSQYRKT